jgi:hypothetical protein
VFCAWFWIVLRGMVLLNVCETVKGFHRGNVLNGVFRPEKTTLECSSKGGDLE